MRELFAQDLFVVGGEIDHQQAAARPQRSRRFAHRARGIVEEVQHLMDDDEVVGVALDRRRVDVALPQQAIAQAFFSDAGAREVQHRRVLIDADGAVGERRDQFQHAARAGAEIEQRVNPLVADQFEDGRFDPLLRRVHGADAVPVGGALGEIGRRLLAPRFARHFQPRAVGGERGIFRRDARDQIAREVAAGLGEPEERPGALALPLREPGVDQQLQVAGNARLRLAENGDQLADREFGFCQQGEQAQARRLARRLERVEQGVERERGMSRIRLRHKDMFICNVES